MGGIKELKNLIYPNNYVGSSVEELLGEKYCRLDQAIPMKNFPFHARVLSAMNLTDTIKGIWEQFQGLVYYLGPEAVFVHVETGDIKVVVDRCFDAKLGVKKRYEFLFTLNPNEDAQGPLNEEEIFHFLVYTTFRLLCIDDPFDGCDTLLQYPYMNSKAIEKIHKGNYQFVFGENSNHCSEYIGDIAPVRWKNLPRFLKQAYTQAFSRGEEECGCVRTAEAWLKIMRQVRDCLVFVNNQFRLCDPDMSNRILFMEIDAYKIPVWAKKAIYWYHVGIDYDTQTNGLVAGINRDGLLENKSQKNWMVNVDGTTSFVEPESSIRLKEGMQIWLTDSAKMQIVSGEIRDDREE